ncbi:MAG: hypothetical protein D6763_03870 [Alphaproteobacteria bacterium]|nr:MAG: hypothetical protein D6763_03870 [Alphaproteobacteria bacterium]
MLLPTDRTVFQNAWVVPDLEVAMRRWIDVCNIGPFFVLDHQDDIVDVTYRGQPSSLTMRLAIAQAGPVQIELVEPAGDGPNCYRDLVKPGQSGFHHVCMWTHDIDADAAHYESMGFPAANMGRVKDSIRFAYFDTSPALNCMVEVMEYSPEVEAIFKVIADAARDWDGDDPIRYV